MIHRCGRPSVAHVTLCLAHAQALPHYATPKFAVNVAAKHCAAHVAMLLLCLEGSCAIMSNVGVALHCNHLSWEARKQNRNGLGLECGCSSTDRCRADDHYANQDSFSRAISTTVPSLHSSPMNSPECMLLQMPSCRKMTSFHASAGITNSSSSEISAQGQCAPHSRVPKTSTQVTKKGINQERGNMHTCGWHNGNVVLQLVAPT